MTTYLETDYGGLQVTAPPRVVTRLPPPRMRIADLAEEKIVYPYTQLGVGRLVAEAPQTCYDDGPESVRPHEHHTKRRFTQRVWLLIAIVCVIVVAAILVGVLVSKKTQSSAPATAPPVPSPSASSSPASPTSQSPTSSGSQPSATSSSAPFETPIHSKNGAFNGTAISAAGSNDGTNNLWFFYQGFQGDLRRITRSTSNEWQSSQSLGLPSVLNGTSIAAGIFADASGTTYVSLMWYIVLSTWSVSG